MAVTADLAKVLDKAYEEKTLTELVEAAVSALAGVSDGDAQLLKEAFNIKTIGDLGRNKVLPRSRGDRRPGQQREVTRRL